MAEAGVAVAEARVGLVDLVAEVLAAVVQVEAGKKTLPKFKTLAKFFLPAST